MQPDRSFVEGKAAVMRGDRWGFIDKNGNEIILPQYDEVGPFTEGLAKFESNGL
ncbi:WG repeat-containing protein [Saccharibacillus alkalitolerans]|uniref:WG repeat-containing protein n=1 Tax=Saccharibacillus alkalitolerans TaxID=2705290 RepID=A0ABX0FC33_9BACL|nr:WG repeat-containing protein [Saccharibacillus alkalitolerans]NGZ77975.1 WG repeat-containing protein [Saccharibacillus alkalitolerans]